DGLPPGRCIFMHNQENTTMTTTAPLSPRRDGLTSKTYVSPLRQFRARCHPPLSLERLADMIGVTPTTVQNWELGIHKIAGRHLPAVCRATGLAPEDLRPIWSAALLAAEALAANPARSDRAIAQKLGISNTTVSF